MIPFLVCINCFALLLLKMSLANVCLCTAPCRGPLIRSAVGLMLYLSGYKSLLMMACFCRERHQDIIWGPHTVHRGFHCQLRGTHSPPRGAVCVAAAKAEVVPS